MGTDMDNKWLMIIAILKEKGLMPGVRADDDGSWPIRCSNNGASNQDKEVFNKGSFRQPLPLRNDV